VNFVDGDASEADAHGKNQRIFPDTVLCALAARDGIGDGLPNLVKISPSKIELGEEFAKFERTW
jgi:hypothetical protein